MYSTTADEWSVTSKAIDYMLTYEERNSDDVLKSNFLDIKLTNVDEIV